MENGTLMDETLANLIAQDTFKLVKEKLQGIKDRLSSGWLKKEYTDLEEEKKYTYLEAETQYKNVIEALKNAGFTDEEEEEKNKEKEADP